MANNYYGSMPISILVCLNGSMVVYSAAKYLSAVNKRIIFDVLENGQAAIKLPSWGYRRLCIWRKTNDVASGCQHFLEFHNTSSAFVASTFRVFDVFK